MVIYLKKQKKTNKKKINKFDDELKNYRKEKRNLKKKLNELLKFKSRSEIGKTINKKPPSLYIYL